MLFAMKYMDIYEALKADIASGAFSMGKRLPGEMAMCRRFGAARNTVRQALELLQRQGILSRNKGEGSFITPRGARTTGLLGLLIPDFKSARFFANLRDALSAGAKKSATGCCWTPPPRRRQMPSRIV